MKIKVIKSCNSENWYTNKIGQIFEIKIHRLKRAYL